MKVLVQDGCLDEARVLALRDARYEVVVAAGEPAVRDALAKARFHVALLGSETATLRSVRSVVTGHPLHLVAVTREITEDQLTAVFDAGADSSFAARAGVPHIQARLRAIQRMLHLPAPPVARDASPLDRVAGAATFRSVFQLLAGAASQLLGLPAAIEQVERARPPQFGSTIVLSSAADQLELRIAVGVDALSARMLAVHLFGDEADDLVADMLNELANIFMGGLKTAFAAESIALTAGLPSQLPAEQVLRPEQVFKHQEVCMFAIQDATLVVHVGLRSKSNILLGYVDLRDGMVLAKDLFNARGLLLINGGTRLSLNMIERLARSVDPKSRIEVLAP